MEFHLTTEIIIGIIVASCVSIIIFFARTIWKIIYGYLLKLFRDLPDIAGSWQTSFNEPDDQGNLNLSHETANLKQVGAIVWGEIASTKAHSIKFKFKGEIRRNLLVGKYTRKDSDKTTGTGAVVLVIRGNNDEMNGQCIWQDYDTDKVEASSYIWHRG